MHIFLNIFAYVYRLIATPFLMQYPRSKTAVNGMGAHIHSNIVYI